MPRSTGISGLVLSHLHRTFHYKVCGLIIILQNSCADYIRRTSVNSTGVVRCLPTTPIRDMVADTNGNKTSPAISLVAGGIAGGVEAACTYPFEFAKTRVQLYGHEGVRNPFYVVAKVAKEEGFRALYKGCSTMIVGSVGKDAVRFLAFDHIRALFTAPDSSGRPRRPTTAESILSGMATGVIASTLIVTPTERIKTALIDDARTSRRFRSPAHCVAVLWAEQGPRRALYAGYAATTLKQIGTTGFRLGSYAALKDYERGLGVQESMGVNLDGPVASFVNGALAGTLTTLVTQPFDTVKTRAQRARDVGGLAECVRGILAEDGVRGFWRGTVMRLGRTVMAGGILFTANEQAVRALKAVFG
ncbi:mitochondrial carrier [Hypoxylon sp. NC1633]|nr:mitochondrial carrier [Hypoxylon sp. NC1633]